MNSQQSAPFVLLLILSVGNAVSAEEVSTEQKLFIQSEAVIDYFVEFDVPREGSLANYGGVLPGGGLAIHWRPHPMIQLGASTNFSNWKNFGYCDVSTRAGVVVANRYVAFVPSVMIGLWVPISHDKDRGGAAILLGGGMTLWIRLSKRIGLSIDFHGEHIFRSYSTMVLRPGIGVVIAF